MLRMRHLVTAASALVLLTSSPGPDARAASPVSELRLSALIHDWKPSGSGTEDGASLGGELLFRSPEMLAWAWAPRPHLGVLVHTAGRTHQLYGGLTWEFAHRSGAFVAGSFGLSVQTGRRIGREPDEASLGSNLLFRSAAEAGWRFGRHSLSVLISHISHAGLFDDQNPGMNHLGLRWGIGF